MVECFAFRMLSSSSDEVDVDIDVDIGCADVYGIDQTSDPGWALGYVLGSSGFYQQIMKRA